MSTPTLQAPAASRSTVRDSVESDAGMQRPDLSIVVPTRNESGNIQELVRRLADAMAGHTVEIIFVDDSSDDTPKVIASIPSTRDLTVKLLHRLPDEREGGLGGAVTLGMSAAQAGWICVMDADLQHPPELMPTLFATAEQSPVDVIVASRYCATGELGNFGRIRTYVSEGSTWLARLAFPTALRGVTDPMSGFFMIRRTSLELSALQPKGFKILFEILARTPGLRVAEVPFRFGERLAGESKASLREGARYVGQLLDLRFGQAWLSFVKFALVGASGILVNVLALALLTEVVGLFYLVSAIAATQASTLWNFGLTELFVFGRPQGSQGRARRAGLFFAMNNAALGLRGPMLFVLATTLGIHYLLANLISLVALMGLRYVAADQLIWGRRDRVPSSTPLVGSTPVSKSFASSPLVGSETVR